MYQVLLADDEPSVLESMKEHIDWEQYGTQAAYTALTGKQAYDILTTSTPDIAILDIRMPGYSGLELSRIISQNKLKTQVIIVSGYAEFSYAQKAIQYGVPGYCLKPVEYDVYYPLASISEHPLSIPSTLIFRIGPSQYGYLAAPPWILPCFATCLNRRVFTVSAIRILLLPLHSSVQHCIAVLPWHTSSLLMQIVVYAVITMILPVCLLCHGFKMLWILVISHVSVTFYMRL